MLVSIVQCWCWWSLSRFEDQLRLRVLTVFPPGEISARPLLPLSLSLSRQTGLDDTEQSWSQSTQIAQTTIDVDHSLAAV